MRIFVCASKSFYPQARSIIDTLEELEHIITPPNGFNEPQMEQQMKDMSHNEYLAWKRAMFKQDAARIEANDGILVLNLEKEGKKNYIGGATFLEMFKAWELGKKIFLYNPIPDGILTDELIGMGPIILNGNLQNIR